jgi:uncharacterized protein
VKLVDANVLVYAVDEDAPNHEVARSWLDGALSGAATVGLSWVALLAFIRLVTNGRIFPAPLGVEDALARVDAWLGQPAAIVVEPTERHWATVSDLLATAGIGGNLVNDAHLAALAVEHRGVVVTYDTDFARFPGVRWERPQPAA